MNEEKIINLLIKLANKAGKNGEIPVSAVVVMNNEIIAKAYNKREKTKKITDHAEIIAIHKSAKKLGRWNLNDCELYVTLIPCNMCLEVIRQSRIKKVYYLTNKLESKHDYSNTDIIELDNSDKKSEYQQILSSFFQNKR